MVANLASKVNGGGRLAVAERLAVERMEFLYCEAMEAWRNSQAIPTASGGKSCGQPRYLAIAVRINMASLEMQTRHDATRRLLRARLAKMQPRKEAEGDSNHPVRDCSPVRGDCQDSGCNGATADDVSGCQQAGYGECLDDRREFLAAQNGSSAPVQPTFDGAGEAIADLVQKQELFPRKLNRQERRARQRQLEKIRRKKGR